MYELYQEQLIETFLEELWSFVAEPENLDRMTPDELKFEIVSDLPESMYEGLIVEYRVTVPILGRTQWVSEIKHIVEGEQFVDEQRIGPYSFWYHYHGLEEVSGGIKMIDSVSYLPPLGSLGALINRWIIRPKLDEIFNDRRQTFDDLFNTNK